MLLRVLHDALEDPPAMLVGGFDEQGDARPTAPARRRWPFLGVAGKILGLYSRHRVDS
jgi:hypothetical protein